MKRITHAIFAVAFLSTTNLWRTGYVSLYAFIAILGSMVPDFDLKLEHRKLLHNIFIPLLISIAIYYIPFPFTYPKFQCVASLLIGWLSHIILDLITIRGVYLIYPLIDKSFSLKLCRSDSALWNTLISVASLLVIASGIRSLVYP
ncbi:MAG: metal-dependent hydrolase [Desulfurococcaceae archaeon]